ncbi:MAG: hypothetical protein WCV59_00845 [Parcubacteria group bacterium]|jgi:hypothetical protein
MGKKFSGFLKKNKFFLAGFLVLIWVVFINIFPNGYVFGGGDTAQFIESGESFKALFFNWNGLASLFYFIFFVLGKIGIGNTAQLSFYLGFIIFGAYISFGIFSRFFFKSSDLSRTTTSLFYALNLYTLFLFTGNWGYSYFPSLYVFIPVLVGLFLEFIQTKNFFYGTLFCVALFFASSGFGNPAFALSFAILLVFLVVTAVILKLADPKKLLTSLFLALIFSFLVSLFWLLPLFPQVKGGVESVNSSSILEFDYEIRNSASPIINTLSLIHFSGDYFPENFYYKGINFLRPVFVVLSFIPIAMVAFGMFFLKNFKNKKTFYLFLFLLLIFTILAARIVYPFEVINYYIFHIWGFSVMRGFDKIAIYIPFFLSVLMLIILTEVKNKKWLYVLAAFAILAPLPFFIGKIQQNAGYRVSARNDYKTASMSFLVKIPNEYYKIRNLINNDTEKSFVATLPATRNDGSGISYYPKWKLYGVDITAYLYNKKMIAANASPFSDWSFADEFNTDYDGNYDWLVKTLGMMNSKYIIYHKDASEDSVKQSEFKIKILEEEGLIKKLEDNDYFVLYEISKNLRVPYISWQKENVDIYPNTESVNRNFDEIINLTKKADFQEINPKKYVVNFERNEFSKNIILAEKFDPLWKAYYVTDTGKEMEVRDHFLARGYANGWKIENNNGIKQIIIEYYPIRLIWRGMAASLSALLILAVYIAYSLKKTNA